jgi:hypothetical protein
MDAKIQGYMNEMKARGDKSGGTGTIFYGLLWRLGINVRPPYFNSYWQNVLWLTCQMLIAAAVIDLLSFSQHRFLDFVWAICFSVTMGAVFARFFANHAKKLNLPKWEDYVPSDPAGNTRSPDSIPGNGNK